MVQAVRNAFSLPDLRRKLLITLGILIIYRLASHVPVPGVDTEVLKSALGGESGVGQLVNILDLLSGGAVSNFSVMAMGVYPYVTASIIFTLLTPIIPQLEALSQEGEAGRNKLNQYQYYLTIPLAALQAIGQIRILESGAQGGQPIIQGFGLTNLTGITTIVTMTAGTMFAIWLGELITEEGVGNGLSVIIFGGIVSRMPSNVRTTYDQDGFVGLVILLAIMIVTLFVIVVVQEGQRRIPVQYGKRVRGRKIYGGQATHIPLRVNTAGMIPLIFAQSILTFPSIVASFFANPAGEQKNLANHISNLFGMQSNWYWPMYFLMVVAFTYFYTDVMVQQQNLPESLRKQGGFIPGIRPGKRTADYINGVMRRITLVGALFLGGVAVLPGVVGIIRGTSGSSTMLIGSTGLLIVVGVVIDTMRQLEAQLLMRHYEGFIK